MSVSAGDAERTLAMIGMVVGEGDGDAFMRAYRQAKERKGRSDRFDQPDPCPICGFTLDTSTFAVFMVPEDLVRKYGREKYIKDDPPRFGWAMHLACAFSCYRAEYDACRP